MVEVSEATLARCLSAVYLDREADALARREYYASLGSAKEAPSFGDLHGLIEGTHTTQPQYNPARWLYPCVDLQPDLVLTSVYTGDAYDPRTLIEDAVALSGARFDLGREALDESSIEGLYPYNCEHAVPQSWFDHEEPMRGDLHHLFTCEASCNSFRGNFPYAEYPDYPAVVRDRCGKRERRGFEPHRSKGMVARATFYFLVRYPGSVDRSLFPPARMDALREWDTATAPTDHELHRNAEIMRIQGNRNPFVDFLDWGANVDFDLGWLGVFTTTVRNQS